MDYGEREHEARKCIEVQSHLSTCLYDWAVAHTLYREQLLCWSTTVSYYAMLHGARTIFSLIETDVRFDSMFNQTQKKRERLKKIMMGHKAFCDFLMDNVTGNDVTLREQCAEAFAESFPETDWRSFLKGIGNVLTLHKEAREIENYEHFVIAHHGRGYHFESPFIDTIFQKSEENMNKHLTQMLSYVIAFYKSLSEQVRDYHLWHQKDELFWLRKTLQKENLVISQWMKTFLCNLQEILKDAKIPKDYYEFEREMDMNYYSEKNEVYTKLEDLAKRITDMNHVKNSNSSQTCTSSDSP